MNKTKPPITAFIDKLTWKLTWNKIIVEQSLYDLADEEAKKNLEVSKRL